MARARVDRLLVERGLAPSRTRARALIEAGKVCANGALVTRASESFEPHVELVLTELDHPYVSRGGVKLEGALRDFGLDVRDAVVADIGASTGGFTDCLLQRGAARVYAIDVGHEQLHPKLRADARVRVMEGVNARELQSADLPERVDLVVIDASFISLEKLLGAVLPLLKREGELLALVKPQFELGPTKVGPRGVVRADDLRQEAVASVTQSAAQLGLVRVRMADSQLPGPMGNREIFVLFRRAGPRP